MEFVHLHNLTHYSMLDSSMTTEELVKTAKKDGQRAVAITDLAVMFGAIDFYQIATANDIKPIIGMECYMANGSRFDKTAMKSNTKRRNYFSIVLLAKNLEGYQNLITLTSKAHLEGFYYKPRIDKELLEECQEGLVCLSGSNNGVIGYHIVNDDLERAYEEAEYYKELFDDDFYLEIQNHFKESDRKVLEHAPQIASELGIELVATNDIRYLKKEHAEAHNVMLLIRDVSAANSGEIDYKELRFETAEYYFKGQEQMIDIFKDFPDAIANTVAIAEKCELELDFDTLHMPDFPIPEESPSETIEEYLRELTYKGLEERYDAITDEIRERADYELGIINKMGFPGYFLIVWDFIRAAKELNVSVGPGRGSAAGSLVAYCLGITNVDPLPYDLLFERFLNPERESMPDIDIDFSDDKRDVIINYVKEKYGANACAQIITFGKLSSKAVLKDVGRVLGIDFATANDVTTKIPVVRGKVTPLEDALELSDLKWLKDTTDEKQQEWIGYSSVLEDKFRHTGIHAAGVVIAPGEITNYVPIYKPQKAKNQSIDIATQFSMQNLEDAGLLKMDFLGLRTLGIIDNTLELIEKNHGDKIDIDSIDFKDKETFDLISRGETLAIFQFESDGMQEYLKQLKPNNLEELTAMNALYRPGPMDNIPEFIDRKFGRKPTKTLHPLMDKILSTTYGIIVFQEQVMLLVQEIADFTLGEADILRRAMGKKKMHIMESMKPKFIEGAGKKGINEKLANEIFDLIHKFADYGFNKSHALAYSYLAFQTAWLKAHYPAEFLAANMTAELNDQDKIVNLREEAKNYGKKVLAPDINRSIAKFNVVDGQIFFGMAAIRNVGENAVNRIVDVRQEKPFQSFFDFVARVDTRLINKRALESLIYAGAFDSLGHKNRRALYESIDNALEYAKALNEHREKNMDALFGNKSTPLPEPELPDVPDWSEKERLDKEKEVLNFYVSGHPMLKYEVPIKSLSTMEFGYAGSVKPGTVERVAGIVTDVRIRRDKKDNSIAFLKLEDFTGKGEIILWSEAYKEFSKYIMPDAILICSGKVQKKGEDIKITAQNILPVEKAIEQYAKGYVIWMELNNIEPEFIKNVKDEFANGGNVSTKFRFNVRDDINDTQTVWQAKDVHIPVNLEITNALSERFGSKNIRYYLGQ